VAVPKVAVSLTDADREMLDRIVSSGVHPARMIMRARVLLALNGDGRRGVAARQVGVSETTVRSVVNRFVESGGDVEAAISRKRREEPPVASVITGDVEARVIRLACSAPPKGFTRWSLRLLEKEILLIEEIPDLDHSTIGRILKKRNFVLI
jgi:transposase